MGFVAKKTVHVSKTIRMDKRLVEALKEEADKAGISLNQIIIQCCEFALDSIDKDKPVLQHIVPDPDEMES